MTTTFNTQQRCLIPTIWQQDLVTANPQFLPEETRRLSFHAKAAWPGYWFLGDELLYKTLFEINILSDTVAKRREEQHSEFEGTVGVLTFLTYEGLPDAETGEKGKPFVSGWFCVSDTVFEDLWERVKIGAAMPCDVWLNLLGMEIDPLGGMDLSMPDDHWDVKKQPKLKILNVRLRFSLPSPKS